ncbi:3695_t:CDS:2, partial [Scutellospora calospora]
LPVLQTDWNLYGSLRTNLININKLEYTWRNSEASMVLTDGSKIVNDLGKRQKCEFMKPRDAIFPIRLYLSARRNLCKFYLVGRSGVTPFATSTSRNEQSEETYIADVIVPLLRTSWKTF